MSDKRRPIGSMLITSGTVVVFVAIALSGYVAAYNLIGERAYPDKITPYVCFSSQWEVSFFRRAAAVESWLTGLDVGIGEIVDDGGPSPVGDDVEPFSSSYP